MDLERSLDEIQKLRTPVLTLLATAVAVPSSPDGNYVIAFKKSLAARDVHSHFAHVHSLHARSRAPCSLIGPLPTGITQNYTTGFFRAYVGCFALSVVSGLKRSPHVAYVEEDVRLDAPELSDTEEPSGSTYRVTGL